MIREKRPYHVRHLCFPKETSRVEPVDQSSLRTVNGLALGALLTAVLAGVPGGAAEGSKLPPELALIPGNALGFVQVRVASCSPVTWDKSCRSDWKRTRPRPAEVVKQLGVAPEEIERFVLIVMNERVQFPLAVITTSSRTTGTRS